MLDSAFQQYIHLSRYARWVENEQRRETWDETVSRLSGFLQERFPEQNIIAAIDTRVRNLDVMPSMRMLMTAGAAANRDNTAIFNCSYTAVNHPRVFDEILYILMCGTGVGFSVERQEVSKLPEVPSDMYDSETSIVVHDSKIGWAKAYKQLVSLLYSGEIPRWDLSKLRPAGARLKTFGGRSSGPDPLDQLFLFTVNTFRGARGRKLNSLEVHDLVCKIGDIVVVGGVRRSALISLSNLSDDRMRDAKSGEWWTQNGQRRLANNSAAYTEKPEVGHFMKEWLSLYDSKSGERGIFNRQAAYKKFQEIERQWKDKQGNPLHVGTNPCLVGETFVAVADGRNAVKIKELADEGGECLVYSAREKLNGQSGWKTEIQKAKAFHSGVKPVVRMILSNGDEFECTPDHRLALKDGDYAEAKDCKGRLLSKFFTFHDKYRRINSYTSGYANQHRMIWEYHNGPKPKDHEIDHIDSFNQHRPDKIENLQLLKIADHRQKTSLERLGKNNPIHRLRDEGKWRLNMSRAQTLEFNGRYNGISNEEIIELAFELQEEGIPITNRNLKKKDNRSPITFSKNRFGGKISNLRDIIEGNKEYNPPEVQPHTPSGYHHEIDYSYLQEDVHVVDIIDEGKTVDVYDLTVEKNHNFYIITSVEDNHIGGNCQGVLVHNCGEILLRDGEFCNLTEVVCRVNDSEKELEEKVRIATIIGTMQSSFTDFRYLRPHWKRNCDEERLLGVSLTGIMDCKLLNKKNKDTEELLGRLRSVARETNKEYAKLLDIEESAAITCVKPSGTASSLVDSSSGIHTRFANKYIRRARSDVKDPLTPFMIEAGFPYEKDIMNEQNIVFEFPIRTPRGSITRDDQSAIEALEFWYMYRTHWCDHNPSVTITVREEEWPEVGAWVWNNFDDIGGVSFLPHSDHVYRQAPYEEVEETALKELEAKMPKNLDWTTLIEEDDETTGSQEYACVGGACEI